MFYYMNVINVSLNVRALSKIRNELFPRDRSLFLFFFFLFLTLVLVKNGDITVLYRGAIVGQPSL